AGERALLLRSPATLTECESPGLRITKEPHGKGETLYLLTPSLEPNSEDPSDPTTYQITFSYQVEVTPNAFALSTGIAAIQRVEIHCDEAGWRFSSPDQIQQESLAPEELADDERSGSRLLLRATGHPQIQRKRLERDLSREDTRFFVESRDLYLPSPGVIEGRHQLAIRPSQGQVSELLATLPPDLTVSEVVGPIQSWTYEASTQSLHIQFSSPQSAPFTISLHTQKGLPPLPTEATLSPILVSEAQGQVGLLALAFGSEAQPDQITSTDLVPVSIRDFEAKLLPSKDSTLHYVARYGQQGASLSLQVVPVAPEIRAHTEEVLSLGEERLVHSITAAVDINRAGIFQLSFPLPANLEVESISGEALNHWTESSAEDGSPLILLHLKGKTMGAQTFHLSLTGPAPPTTSAWDVPRFSFVETSRQTGQLTLRPAPGLRLRTLQRRNLTELDPRSLGRPMQGSLAFRLLQKDWSLQLDLEQLAAWLTGQALQEVTVREGQSRSVLHAQFRVENASVRQITFRLPDSILTEESRKTLRATGQTVASLSQPDPTNDPQLWAIQLKRRVLGDLPFRLEWERRDESSGSTELLTPVVFPDLRQIAHYHALRSGGRLDTLLPESLPQGWQVTDWNSVPAKLRQAGTRNAPALTLRSVDVSEPLPLELQRHELADALKLRVSRGTLTTFLSPLGDELTSVDLQMDVVQRSSLSVGLPQSAKLFGIFVNGESVRAVQQGDAYQFYVLPGPDDRSANVRFTFSQEGERRLQLRLVSPRLNVPLVNIDWNVILPKGFTLADHRGNLELEATAANWSSSKKMALLRDVYLSRSNEAKVQFKKQSEEVLEQANSYLQQGEQQKARRLFSNAANQIGLDAASNEDARVQLENLQTDQAVVGLNTRRQRLYLDNGLSTGKDTDQMRVAIEDNPIIMENDLNFRPQDVSQQLQYNSDEDNTVLRRIGSRLVQHQRSLEPAPPALAATLPEGENRYVFRRTVQVGEAPLSLRLNLASADALPTANYLWFFLLGLLFIASLVYLRREHDQP
ncbi:MAG: hypothetical protein AAF191_11605, partial [Verrucomicrobiota bacterium]